MRFIIALLLLIPAALCAQSLLQRADSMAIRDGTAAIDLTLEPGKGRTLRYSLKLEKAGPLCRLTFQEPRQNRGDFALVLTNRLYFKYKSWPRPDIMSPDAGMLDLPLPWRALLLQPLDGRYQALGEQTAGNLRLQALTGQIYPFAVVSATNGAITRSYLNNEKKIMLSETFEMTNGRLSLTVTDPTLGTRAVMMVQITGRDPAPQIRFRESFLNSGPVW